MKRLLALLPLVLLVLAAGPSLADERIHRYDAEITIRPDGSLYVAETIDVRAEGRQIRRGIFRDFPTVYRDALGNRVTVPFDVVAVTRDGQPEPWHTEGVTGGTRLYIGDAGTFLEPGKYSYRIEYTTDRQLGHFEAHDELYWNVTGNDWAFPIDAVEATVRLPADVARNDLRIDAYLGEAGSQGSEWTAEVTARDTVRFVSGRALDPYEGLTIAVGFPKGLVPEPSALERGQRLLVDNRGAIVGLIGLLFVIGWQAWAWNRVGRDPLPGAIYPRYEAPEGYSPGMLRYVLKFGYDKTATAAALVHMAVLGHVVLDKPKKRFVVRRGEGTPESKTEKALFEALFAGGDSLTFEQAEHARVGKAVKAHEKALRSRMETHYFRHNRRWWVPGLLIALVSVLLMTVLVRTPEPGLAPFLALFSILWNGFVGVVVAGIYKGWKEVTGLKILPMLILSVFMVPFVFAGLVILGVFGWQVGVLPMLVLLAHLALTLTFYQLMKAPTERGTRPPRCHPGPAAVPEHRRARGSRAPPRRRPARDDRGIRAPVALRHRARQCRDLGRALRGRHPPGRDRRLDQEPQLVQRLDDGWKAVQRRDPVEIPGRRPVQQHRRLRLPARLVVGRRWRGLLRRRRRRRRGRRLVETSIVGLA